MAESLNNSLEEVKEKPFGLREAEDLRIDLEEVYNYLDSAGYVLATNPKSRGRKRLELKVDGKDYILIPESLFSASSINFSGGKLTIFPKERGQRVGRGDIRSMQIWFSSGPLKPGDKRSFSRVGIYVERFTTYVKEIDAWNTQINNVAELEFTSHGDGEVVGQDRPDYLRDFVGKYVEAIQRIKVTEEAKRGRVELSDDIIDF